MSHVKDPTHYTIQLNIEAELIDKVIAGAHIKYWGRTTLVDDGHNDDYLAVVDRLSGDEYHRLGAEQIKLGIEMMIKKAPKSFGIMLTGYGDGTIGDMFIQYCVFGSLKYG